MNKIAVFLTILIIAIAGHAFIHQKSVKYYLLNNCQEINQPGVYVLKNDILSSVTCLTIKADKVVIQGNGHTLTGPKKANQSAIEVIDHTQVNIENITINEFGAAISFIGVTKSEIRNAKMASNLYAISSINSSELTITNNVLDANFFGVYFVNTSKSKVERNYMASSGNRAIGIVSSDNNMFKSNFLERNLIPFDAIASSNNTYQSNNFFKNINSLFSVSRNTSLIAENEKVNFTVSLPYSPKESCESCSYSIELFPNESSFSYIANNDEIYVSFAPTRTGMYSLFMHITDKNNNTDLKKIMYLVGPTREETVSYYLRGTDPVHGQSISWGNYNADSGSLLANAPYDVEQRSCSDWIQFSPDELPPYLFGTVHNIDVSLEYTQNASNASLGIERFATYDRTTDREIPLDVALTKKVQQASFDVNWPINYYWQWYWLTIKVATPGGWPTIYIDPAHAPKASISYNYSFTPAILSLESNKASLLSATMRGNEVLLETEGNEVMKLKIEMPEASLNYKALLDEVDCDISSDCLMIQRAGGEIDLTLNAKGKNSVRIVPVD